MKSVLLVASVVVNAALLTTFALQPERVPDALKGFFPAPGAATPATPRASPEISAKSTSPAPELKTELWSQLGAADLRTTIARLRAAGFPANVIREIVRVQVAEQFRDRMMAAQGPTPNTPYWRDNSSFMPNSARFEETRKLDRERASLLRQLLADDFFSTSDVTAGQRRQFGNLSSQQIDALQRIEDDYGEMMGQIRAGMNNITLPEDREKFTLLDRERRTDLGAILNPEQLSEYLMRTSPITSMLRTRLDAFDPTAAEYQAIFNAQMAYNERVGPNAFNMPQDVEQRRAMQAALDADLKAGLGARYADFVRTTNNEYLQLNRLAQRDNLPPGTVDRAFAIRDSVSQASNQIADDTALSPDQKRAALQTLAQQTRTQILSTLGPVSGPTYVQVVEPWLGNVERGSAVTFDGPGNGMSISMGVNGNPVAVALGGGSPTYRRVGAPARPPQAPPAPNR